MDKTIEVVTFGCRLNSYESNVIRSNLNDMGLENIVVFNTCAVTSEAERQAKQAIRRMKRENPEKKIIVTGCAAQLNPQKFISMPEVEKVLGNIEKLDYKSYLDTKNKVLVNDIMSVKETASHFVKSFNEKSRAFIEVQNGCNHRCTFCIIPFARGRSRSVPIGAIATQIQVLINEGYKEIVLTGVDITGYGIDLPGKPSFAQMIKRVLNLVPELQRLRISSIDVAEVDPELFDLFAYEKRILPYVHISSQSGSDIILKRMMRRHKREHVINFCNKLREKRKNISFGADLIAGFPTEDDDMFADTVRLVDEAGLSFLHVFPYSERSGTKASEMPQLPKSIRKERAQILINKGKQNMLNFFDANIGQTHKILVEQNNLGYTENFIQVKFEHNTQFNLIVNAKLTRIKNNYVIAEII